MTRQPHVAAYPDHPDEHRARIVAANGDIIFVSSQSYNNEDDLIIARELARRTLNDEINNDPAYRVRVETLMAQRDAKSVRENAPPRSKLAEALSRRADIGAPTLDRLFGLGPDRDR